MIINLYLAKGIFDHKPTITDIRDSISASDPVATAIDKHLFSEYLSTMGLRVYSNMASNTVYTTEMLYYKDDAGNIITPHITDDYYVMMR